MSDTKSDDVAKSAAERPSGDAPSAAKADAADASGEAKVKGEGAADGDANAAGESDGDEDGAGATGGEATGAADGDAKADEATAGDAEPPRAAKEKESEEEPPLVARGNDLRWGRGLAAVGVGFVGLFLLVAKSSQWSIGVPLGVLFTAITTWGVMDLLGSFDDPADRTVGTTTLGDLAIPLAGFGGALLAFCVALGLAGAGLGPTWIWMVCVPCTFIVLVAAFYRLGVALGPWARDEDGNPRRLVERHGFWVLAVGAALYLPTMGTFSLWDPWETHYGEVAREILARDDWISLWWAQDGWFWSKPILNFWIQSLSMASLGTHYQADQMMHGAGVWGAARPEWVVRTPNVLMTLCAMYFLYKGVAKVFGRRAGLLGAIVLATMPDWYFLAHQTMTDMPFVAAMTATMGLLMLGLNTDEEERVRLYEVRVGATKLRLSAWHLVFGVILLCAIPQIVYLVTRNVDLVVGGASAKGFRVHWDEFQSGSASNCGMPGNEACRAVSPASVPKSALGHPQGVQILVRLFGGFEPIIQAIVWAGVLGGLLYLNWGERRTRRIIYVAAWFCAALATMAKGPAGFVLPIVCAFAYVATKKRWSELLRVELLSGLLVILCVALPWYVAMYVRHGSPFTDRLIFHDMFNRAFGHVHDTNEGDDTSFRFYLWQLGYALFPWTGLAPLGITFWMRRGDSAGKGRGDASVLLVMWFIFAFGLFSFMGTKFHHYIFPAVPPVAMLVGVVLDDMLGKKPVELRSLPAYVASLVVGAGLTTYGLSRFFPGSVFGGRDPASGAMAPASVVTALVLVVAGVACLFAGPLALGRKPEREDEDDELDAPYVEPAPLEASADTPYRGAVKLADQPAEARHHLHHERLMVAGAAVAGALLLVLVGRDLSLDAKATGDLPGQIRLLQLFTYNYRRPWPDSLDFGAILTGFSIAAVALGLALGVRAIRKHATAAFLAFAFVWAVWGVDVYMVKTAPHWGQHEVVEAYYRDRTGPDEMLVAYQMNWKGENFYTGNRVPAFVSSGATFTSWLKGQKDKGVKVMYFVTEHGRTGGLKSEVNPKSYKEITDRSVCNKFVLVRTEL